MTLPYTDRRGPKAGNCHTKPEVIHKVCQLLQDKPTLSAKVVARMCGIQPGIVYSIVKGITWPHISAEYNFSKRHEYNMRWGPITPARLAKQLERRLEQQRKQNETTTKTKAN